jgi:hypothetical protein
MASVLIVDDEPDILTGPEGFLTSQGYSVRTACDGPEAIRAVDAQRPQAVLLTRGPRDHGLRLSRRGDSLNGDDDGGLGRSTKAHHVSGSPHPARPHPDRRSRMSGIR